MAILEDNCLHIQKGKFPYLLLRGDSHFHLIRRDANLPDSKLEKLFRLYPCEEAQLRKLNIHFSAFKTKNLRGVTVKGYKAGDSLELWLGGDIREYRLSKDYPRETLAAFFDGYPIWDRVSPLRESEDPKHISKITWLLNGLSVVCAVIFCFAATSYWLPSCLCMLFQLCAMILPVLYPNVFSLFNGDRKGNLAAALLAPGFALVWRTLIDFTFENSAFGSMLLISGGIWLVAFLLIFWIRRHTPHRVIVSVSVIILMAFLGMGNVGQLNYLLDHGNGVSRTEQVVEKKTSKGSKATTYYCYVQMPNGDTVELTVSPQIYRNTDVGDDLVVTSYEGAFGIPFTMAEVDTH